MAAKSKSPKGKTRASRLKNRQPTDAAKKSESAQRRAAHESADVVKASREVVRTDDDEQRPGPPVAGMGASAGGLDAFKKFFTAMPADSGIAFVLIPHLDPRHESLMVELIARHTKMPVVEAADGMAAEADHIYIIPPNKYMTISDGVLRLTGPVERAGPQTSIDVFLRSLAEDKREKAICIILSGTGSHGTLGLQAVKAAGGMAVVQDPGTADYPAMPQSAIATGLADHILHVEEMPGALTTYIDHYVNGRKAEAEEAKTPDDLNQVLALLRARKRLDFRCYRKRMLTRRIERRMSLSHFSRIADYLAFLREHPDEVNHLSRDLLISVTSFFRDPEAWQALETNVIAPLVRGREPDTPLRCWSAGCATGEEPYSLGMLLLEQLTAAQKTCPVQIFGTDIDEDALQVARQATYPESISTDVSPERLSQFFTRVSDVAYQVSKQLRETVTFARQNLVTEAPFSKLDLVVCRNLLIYLEPELQKKVVALLHFSLNPGGFLFLGPSETIGRNLDLFEPVSAKWRIYRRIGPSRLQNVQFPAMELEPRQTKRKPIGPRRPLPRLGDVAQNYLLRKYDLALVVINRNYEVLHFAGPTDDYLVQPAGPPTQDLLSLARPGLASKMRVAVQRAIRENAPQSIKDVMMRSATVARRVNIDVEPLTVSKDTDGLLLVAFHEQRKPVKTTLEKAKARSRQEEPDLTRQLEQELETTREDLQSTIEELESSNEELKASNEEIMSMNEELQSSNEELETSKEELQSLNEELTTVNGQLQEKVHDLEVANNDMANLFNCTNIATLFLDTELRIKRFTPATTRLFNLIASDIGRPIGDIVRKFTDEALLRDAQEFLRDLVPREKEVRTEEGRWCLRRIVPYRTLDNRIEGIVTTFVDITERKLAADATVQRLAAIVESSADVIYCMDLDGTIRTWNRAAEKLYGYTAEEIMGRSVGTIVPQDRAGQLADILSRLAQGETIQQLETERLCKDGNSVPASITVSPIRDGEAKVIGASVIARDITERKRAEEMLRDQEARLRAILNTAADAIITIDEQGIIQSVNPATERLFGFTAEEIVGQNVSLLMPSPYREEHDQYLRRYRETGQARIIGIGREVVGQRKDGTTFAADLAVSRVDPLNLFTGIIRDVTRRKDLEREVVEIASLQQRRIGEDLHDQVGQELTALNLLVGDLAETVRTDPRKAEDIIVRIAQGLRRSQQELRGALHGLIHTSIDADGLTGALSELANRIQSEGKVVCTCQCPEKVTVRDNLTATHLYLITQEAVHNATKHAQAKEVRIALEKTDGTLFLSVTDDGVGMPQSPTDHRGLGLRIMQNRAAILGAKLSIEPAEPRGTRVKCIFIGDK